MPTPTAAQQAYKERRLIMWLYAGTVLLLVILLFNTYRTISRYEEVVVATRQATERRAALNAVMLDMVDQETSIRGYLLTGKRSFLIPMMRSKVRITDNLERLKAACMSRLDSSRTDTISTLSQWLTSRYNERYLEMQNGTFHADTLHTGELIMDQMRSVYNRFDSQIEDEHSKFLRQHRTTVGTPLMLTVYGLFSLVATALLFARLQRLGRKVERARSALAMRVEQLDAESKLRKRYEELNEKVFDLSPSGIMTFRSVRDDSGTIIDFEWLSSNPAANKVAQRSDLLGKWLLKEMPENRAVGLFDAYSNVANTGVPFEQELHYQNGLTDMWLMIRAVKLDDGFLVLFDDISDRKRLELSIQNEERFAQAGQLMRTVAHEVRNPLTNIGLAIEQIAEEVKAQNAYEGSEPFFAIIDRNLKRIGELIKGMLESTRERELNLAPEQLPSLIQAVGSAVKDRLTLQRMQMVVEPTGPLPTVLVDKDLLVLAMTNLAVNAIEAMENGNGVLRVTMEHLGQELILTMRDNGKGIPPDQLDKLFRPFYSGRPGGLGLGLTTARSIFSAHKIPIRVESTVGKGTTVIARFPLSRP